LKEKLREADFLHILWVEACRRQSLFLRIKGKKYCVRVCRFAVNSAMHSDPQNYKGLFVDSNITVLISVRTYTVLIYILF